MAAEISGPGDGAINQPGIPETPQGPGGGSLRSPEPTGVPTLGNTPASENQRRPDRNPRLPSHMWRPSVETSGSAETSPVPGTIRGLEQIGENVFIPRGSDPEAKDTLRLRDVFLAYDHDTGCYLIMGEPEDSGTGDEKKKILLDTDLNTVDLQTTGFADSFREDCIVVSVEVPNSGLSRRVKLTPDGVYRYEDGERAFIRTISEHSLATQLTTDDSLTLGAVNDWLTKRFNLPKKKAPKLSAPKIFQADAQKDTSTEAPGLHEGWVFGPRAEAVPTVNTVDGGTRPLFDLVHGIVDPQTGETAVVGRTGEEVYLLDATYTPVIPLNETMPEGIVWFALPEESFTGADLARLAREAHPDVTEPRLVGQTQLDIVHQNRADAAKKLFFKPQISKYMEQELFLPDLHDTEKTYPKVKEENGKYMLETPAFGHERYAYDRIFLAVDPDTNTVVPMGAIYHKSGNEYKKRFVAINPQTFEPLTDKIQWPISVNESTIIATNYGADMGYRELVTASEMKFVPVQDGDIHEVDYVDISDALVSGNLTYSESAQAAADEIGVEPDRLRWGFSEVYGLRRERAWLQDSEKYLDPIHKEQLLQRDLRIAEELQTVTKDVATEPRQLGGTTKLPVVDRGGYTLDGDFLGNNHYFLAVDAQTRTVGIIKRSADGIEHLVDPQNLSHVAPGAESIVALGRDGMVVQIGDRHVGFSAADATQLEPGNLLLYDLTPHMGEGLNGETLAYLAKAMVGADGEPMRFAFDTAYTHPELMKAVPNVSGQRQGTEIDLDAYIFPPFRQNYGTLHPADYGRDVVYDVADIQIDLSNGQFSYVGSVYDNGTYYHHILGPDQRRMNSDLFVEIAGFEGDYVIGKRQGDKVLHKVPLFGGEAIEIPKAELPQYKTRMASMPIKDDSSLAEVKTKIAARMGDHITPGLAFEDMFTNLLQAQNAPLPEHESGVFSEETFNFPAFYLDRVDGKWHGEVNPGRGYEQISILVTWDGRIALAGEFLQDGERLYDILGPNQNRLGVSLAEIQDFGERGGIIGRLPQETVFRGWPLNSRYFVSDESFSADSSDAVSVTQIAIPPQALEAGLPLSSMKKLAAVAMDRTEYELGFAFPHAFSAMLGVENKTSEVPFHIRDFAEKVKILVDQRQGETWPDVQGNYTFPKIVSIANSYFPEHVADGKDISNAINYLKYVVDTRTGNSALIAQYSGMEHILHPDLTRSLPPISHVLSLNDHEILADVGKRLIAIRSEGVVDLGPFEGMHTVDPSRMKSVWVDPHFCEGVTLEELKTLWHREHADETDVNQKFLRVPSYSGETDLDRLRAQWQFGELGDDVVIGGLLPERVKRSLSDPIPGRPEHGFSVAVDTQTGQVAVVEVASREAPHDVPNGENQNETITVSEFFLVHPVSGVRLSEIGDGIGLDQIMHLEPTGITGLQRGDVVTMRDGRFDILDTAYDADSSVVMMDVTAEIAAGRLTGADVKRIASQITNIEIAKLKLTDPRAGLPVKENGNVLSQLSPEQRVSVLIDALGTIVKTDALPEDFRDHLIQANSFLIGLQNAEFEAIDEERLAKGAKYVSTGTWEVVEHAIADWKADPDQYTGEAAAQYLARLDPEGDEFGYAFEKLAVPDVKTFELLVSYLKARQMVENVDSEAFKNITAARWHELVTPTAFAEIFGNAVGAMKKQYVVGGYRHIKRMIRFGRTGEY